MTTTFFKYILSFILILFAGVLLIQSDYISLFREITPFNLLLSILMCLFIFSVTGLKVRSLALSQFNVRIKPIDVITLPIAMNLSSFFIPVKGGMLYQIFFLKMKYKINFAAGISISAYNHLMTLVLYGILGLYYICKTGVFFSIGTIVALAFLFSPLIITLLHKLFAPIQFDRTTIRGKLKTAIDSIVSNHNRLWSNKQILGYLFLLTLVHTMGRIYWVYFATLIFGLNISFLTMISMALITELSIIFRFVPGNIGIYELFSGGVFQALGEPLETGILIALFLRLTSIIVTFTIGVAALQANLKYFALRDSKSIWEVLKKSYDNI